MAKFLRKSSFGGMDWHDICTTGMQLSDAANGTVEHPMGVIFKDITNDLFLLDQDKKIIHDFLAKKESGSITVYPGTEEEHDGIRVFVPSEEDHGMGDGYSNEATITIKDNEVDMHTSFAYGQVEYDTYYKTVDIPDDQVIYIPILEYWNGLKYGDTDDKFEFITKDYNKAAKFVEEHEAKKRSLLGLSAEDYLPGSLSDYEFSQLIPGYDYSRAYVMAFSREELTTNKWFTSAAAGQKIKEI